MQVKSYIPKGNSFPIIIEDLGHNYFVKLRAGMSGKHSLITEFIGNRLGSQLNLPTQDPTWIELDEKLDCENLYIEVKELITKSQGTNIAFQYLEELKEVKVEELNALDQELKDEIFLFDILMVNIDRTLDNTNLLWHRHSLTVIDYESSLLIQALIGKAPLIEDIKILEGLRDNPLYNHIDQKTINRFISKTQGLSIANILEDIPNHLLDRNLRQQIIDGFEEKQKIDWRIKETMHSLRSVTIETKEEKKKRRNKNQAEFLRKFKETLKD